MSNELKALMEEYIKLLEQEVGSHTAFLFVHGQKPDSLRVSEGHRLRKAIEIENSRPTEPKTKIAEIDEAIGNIEYHYQGMGCGLEDIGITDRYDAMQHGWDKAMERVFEVLNQFCDEVKK